VDASWRCGAHRCATNCDGRTVKVITGDEDVDYSTETGGVCAIADTTVNSGWIETDVTLTEHDDCFVIVTGAALFGATDTAGFGDDPKTNKLLGLGGDDVLCGSAANDYNFYGMHMQRLTPLDVITRGPCPSLHRFPKPCSQVVTVTISSRLGRAMTESSGAMPAMTRYSVGRRRYLLLLRRAPR